MEQTCTEFLTRSPLASQGLSHLPPGPGAQPLASCLITQGHAPFVGSALPVALPHPASSSRPAQAPHGIGVLLLLFPTRDTRGAQRLCLFSVCLRLESQVDLKLTCNQKILQALSVFLFSLQG